MDEQPDLTIIMVSYNTRDLTLAAIHTCLKTTRETAYHLIVLDNASTDGSADAIAAAYANDPRVTLIRSEDNLGFAKANNVVADRVETEFLLLLNPDTECHAGAVDNLMRFARETRTAGIWGGRTVFPDGQLNPSSCWMQITPWSLLAWAVGLTGAFPNTQLCNPEALGGWRRDSVREVDIVSGCFFLVDRTLWTAMGGFDLDYFMYGEEADLCLRARRLKDARPQITPEAQIMHVAGASTRQQARKRSMVLKARTTLVRRHWPAKRVPLGIAVLWAGVGLRYLAARVGAAVLRSPKWTERAENQRAIWGERDDWLAGY